MKRNYHKAENHIFRWISIILFIGAITAPMFGHFAGVFDESYIINTEKRQPNPLPERSVFKTPKVFISSLESYLNDHFGFRQKLVRLNSLLRLELGASFSEKVVVGKDGWLYYSAENIIEQYRGIENFSAKEMDSWIDAGLSRKVWFKERNIPYFFAFYPEKTSVYPEYLPAWATKIGPIRRDQIKKRLEEAGIDFVDATPSILEAKEKYPVYFKTDSHWNYHGGFEGYLALMGLVKKYFPGITPLTRDDIEFGFKESRAQDLALILNLTGYLRDPNADYYQLRNPSRVISSEFLNNDEKQRPLLVRSNIIGAPKVLIIKDSYTDLMAPFLNETFREVLYLPHGDHTIDEELILKFKPDLVISAMVERILRYPLNAIIPSGSPYIIDWGPKEIFVGKEFFIQPDGSSAMWIKAKNLSMSTEIAIGTTRLKSSPDVAQGVITGIVPDFLYNSPRINDIMLIDDKKGTQSQKVKIVVNP